MAAMQRLDTRLREAGHRPVGGTDELRASVMALCSPQTWDRRWRSLGVTAAAILFLVIGQQLFSAPYDPEARAFSGALTHEIWLNDNSTFSLPWLDPDSLKDVLRQEGLTEIPNLSPVGFHLVRARVSRPLRQVFVQLVYRQRSEEISIFISRRWKRSSNRASAATTGLRLSPSAFVPFFWSAKIVRPISRTFISWPRKKSTPCRPEPPRTGASLPVPACPSLLTPSCPAPASPSRTPSGPD